MLLSASPSIDDLLQQLQGGGDTSQHIPIQTGMSGGTNPAPPMNIALAGGLLNTPAPDAARPTMADRIIGKMPAWMQAAKASGLVSDEDIANSKPSVMRSLLDHPLSGGGQDVWENNLNKVIQMHQLAQGVGEHSRVLQARQQMAQLFPAKPGETAEEMDNRLEAMYGYAVQHGDLEMAKSIGDVVKETAKRPRPLVPPEPQQVHGIISQGEFANGKFKGQTVTQLRDPYTHQVIAEMPEGALPMSDDAKAFRAAAQASLDATRAVTEGQRNDALDNGQARNFTTTNAPLTTKGPKYNNFFNLLNEVRNGNEAAIEPLKYAAVQAIDTNAQMRQGILDRLERVRQSLGGQTGVKASLALKGQLPQSVLDDMEKMVKSAASTDKALYKEHYDYAVSKNSRLANHPDIAPPDVVFNIPGAAGEAVKSGVEKVKGFLPTKK